MTSSSVSRRNIIAGIAGIGVAAAMPPAVLAQGVGREGRERRLPQRGEFFITGVEILSMDASIGHLAKGDIHIRDGAIVAVGPALARPARARVIRADQMIAMPGLIDTHSHLWNTPLRSLAGDGPKNYFPTRDALGPHYQPIDNYNGVMLGIAEMLTSGVTTTHNWSHNIRSPEYADAEIRAMREAGIRGLFSYGYPAGTGANTLSPTQQMDVADLQRVKRQYFDGKQRNASGMLSLGAAIRSLNFTTRPNPGAVADWKSARDLGLVITVHASGRGTGAALEEHGLLGPDVLLINGSGHTDAEREILAKRRVRVAMAPYSNMRSTHNLPPVSSLLNAGILTGISFDTPAIAGNNDFFSQMRVLFDTEIVRTNSEVALTMPRVVELATIEGARVLGIDDITGSLTPGKRADVILISKTDLNMVPVSDAYAAIVHSASPSNVRSVFVDGRLLKHDGRLQHLDAGEIGRRATETIVRARGLAKL
jgi:cytosine/adenosine deaminase-related metal-dependent hydrolase